MAVRRLLAVVAALVLSVVGAGATALDAHAEAYDGPCRDNLGVTVVVDYQGLGGATVVRCAANFRPGGTGYEALQQAGFTTTGTFSDGPGFVCRINNRPSRTETITVQGRTYTESCRETPPAWAFWSYWHAPNGGEWSFSNLGVMGHKAIIGGYEGWSFSMGASAGSNPPPRVRPQHDAITITPSAPATTATSAPAATASATTPAPATATTPAPSTARASTPASRPTPNRSTTPTKRPRPTQSASSAAPSVSPSPRPTLTSAPPTQTSPRSSESPTPSAMASVTVDTTETAPATTTATDATAAPVPAEVPADGPGMGTFLGVGALSVIAAASGVVVWRRRRLL